MLPAPLAVGLTLCHYASVEEGTHHVSLAGCFLDFDATEFSFAPSPFFVYCALIGAQGTGSAELTITQLEDDEELFRSEVPVTFPDRFHEVLVLFRLTNCVFPEAGEYLFTLLVDGEWMAQRRVVVSEMEEDT